MRSLFTTPVLLFVAFLGVGFACNLVFYAMIGEVNRKLPEGQRINYLYMYPGKLGKVWSEHKRLHPSGRLRAALALLAGLLIVLFLGVAWSMGFLH
jgi:hypothetical protein